MNYYDILFSKFLNKSGGGSSVEVEPLSVTENGTYTAEHGKAYSPVTVNVSGGLSNPIIEVTYVNESNDDAQMNVSNPYVIEENNLISFLYFNIASGGSHKVDAIACFDEEGDACYWNVPLMRTLPLVSASNEVNCTFDGEDGEYWIIVTDPTKSASITITQNTNPIG